VSATPERKAGQQALLHFLQRQGKLSSEQAAQVEKSIADGASVQEALDRAGVISEKELAQFLATTLGLRPVDLTTFPLDPQTARELKETVATRYGVLPLRVDGLTMDIATANPLDLEALKAVEFATGKRVRALVATQVEIRDAMAHAYNLQGSLEQFLQHVPENESLTVAELRDEHGDLRTIAHDAELPPVIRLADLMLIEAIKSRSSDVHVEPSLDTVLVRYRVDGILEEAFRFPKWVQNPLIARLKIMAKLDITERRVPQDGRIRLRYQDKHVDLRVSSLPSQHGEKITLRILDAGTSLQHLDRIGLNQRHLPLMREAVRRPQGMVLITGPTGSGKTTTLYAVLREIYSTNISVVTIEDPIEYQLKGINQVEVNDKQGRTFASVLRSVLRQDPDVILIGEIRDRETAQIAFQAAQTGHLVLTTVHTNDAAGAVTRLIDLGLDPRAVASTVNIVVAQRLVRRICSSCGTPEPIADDVRHALRLPADLTAATRGTGCGACRQSGYVGRTGVYELFPITASIAKLLETGAGETAVRQQARAEGYPGMLEDATEKLKGGITSAEELLRVVYVKEDNPRCPGCRKEIAEDYAVCPHCSKVLRATCGGCNKPLSSDWTACPYCGTSVNAISPRSTAAASSAMPAPAPDASRTFRALVVDDTEHIREIVRVALEKSDLNLQVVTAGSGEEALAAAARERPDVVVLDISMPDMDGFEVCRRLRTEVRTAFVPVLLLTAHDSEDFIARGFGVGADDYMVKPFRRDDLIARLRRMLERTYGSGVAPDLSEAPPAPAEVTAPPAMAPIDTAALDRLSAEVAGLAGTQGALLERLETCERMVAETAAGSGGEARAPRADDSEEIRASLDEIRQLVGAARTEQVKTLTALAARLDAVEARAPKGGGKADSTTVARLAALDQAVERLESEQSEMATALAARAGTEEAQSEDCERKLATLTARLDAMESRGAKGGKAAGETTERLAALQESLARLRTEQGELATALAARSGAEDAQNQECERRLAVLAARLEVVEAEESTVARTASETADVLASVQQGLADVRAAQAAAGEDLAARAESERSQDEECGRRLAELAARLDQLQAAGSAEDQIASEAADRVAELQAALADLRAAQASASEGLRDARSRFDEFSARIAADDPEREHLKEMVGQGEARLAELSKRLQGESARLDMLLSLVDGCETQLTDFAGRLEKDLLRRDTLMALVDGCEAQLTELAQRLTGKSAGQGASGGLPTIDLHQRLKALNAMLAERTGEGEAPDPGTALRVRTEIFGQLRRQLDELRAGAPWPAAARKTLALLVDSTLAATIAPVVRGALQATGMSSFFESPAADEPAEEQREEARAYYDDPM
jgi:type IV pilus assembly protein PilB